MVLGMVSTNCYLVYNNDTKEGVVVDPADNGAYILNKCSELGVTPVAVLFDTWAFLTILSECLR